jgi:hypothetical protein
MEKLWFMALICMLLVPLVPALIDDTDLPEEQARQLSTPFLPALSNPRGGLWLLVSISMLSFLIVSAL